MPTKLASVHPPFFSCSRQMSIFLCCWPFKSTVTLPALLLLLLLWLGTSDALLLDSSREVLLDPPGHQQEEFDQQLDGLPVEESGRFQRAEDQIIREEEDGEGEGSGEEMPAIEALLDAFPLDEDGEGGVGQRASAGNNATAALAEGTASGNNNTTGAANESGLPTSVAPSSSSEKPKGTDHCQPKLDVVFLLDTSGSIEQLYQEHVRWAVTLVESLPLEHDTVRVAAVQYAGFPLTEFALGTYPSAEDIRQHLQRVQLQSGVTRTGYALRKAESELFRPDRGARNEAAKLVVLFTDGRSVDDPLKPALQLRVLKHVKIFVVSLGVADSFRPELNRIAGHEENLFGPDDLARLREALLTEVERARACSRIGDDAFNNNGPRGNALGGFAEDRDPEEEEEQTLSTAAAEQEVPADQQPLNGTVAEAAQLAEHEQLLAAAGINAAEMLAVDEQEEEHEEKVPTKEEEVGGQEVKKEEAGREDAAKDPEEAIPVQVTQQQSVPLPPGGKEEEPQPLDEWGLRQGVQEAIDRRINEPKSSSSVVVDDDEQRSESLLPEGQTANAISSSTTTTKIEAETPTLAPAASTPPSSTTTLPAAIEPLSALPDEQADVFEPVDGMPVRSRPLLDFASVTHQPSPPPLPSSAISVSSASASSSIQPRRTFPVRVELAPAISGRRPLAERMMNSRLQQLLRAQAGVRELPAASISASKGLTKTVVTTSRPVTVMPEFTSPTFKTRTSTVSSSSRSQKIGPLVSSNSNPRTTPTATTRPNTKPIATTSTATTITTTRWITTTSQHPRPRAFGLQTAAVACPPLDVLFLLDSSGSVGRVYEAQKEWLEHILEQIRLMDNSGASGDQQHQQVINNAGGNNGNGHRVALIQFAGIDLQKTEWEWDRFRENGQMMDAFHQVRHLTGTTYIGQALQQALLVLEKRRRQVPTLVVLLSDGFSQDDAAKLAQQMRQLVNLQFFALSIGDLSNTEYLHRLVGDPSHVFIGAQSGDLLRAQLLRRLRCG